MSCCDASPNFDQYRRQYDVRSPDLTTQKYPDELADLSSSPGVESMTVAPTAKPTCASEPGVANQTLMHIWLVTSDRVPYALEHGELGKTTQRRRLAHTNLSGGRDAHAGGELWFKDEMAIWLTGGSGRYPPRSAAELGALVDAFRTSGYSVCSCGWDNDTNRPARLFRSPTLFEAPLAQ